MKPIKGLCLNRSIYDIPEGHVVMARNAINSYLEGSVIKEKGFIALDKVPYTPIGYIETPLKTYIYSTDDINSAISVLENDIVTTIIDDRFRSFKFKFKKSNPIKGVAIKNYRNEWIGVWLDELNPIRIINFDNPLVQVEADLSLFANYQIPTVTHIVQDGGNLNKGSYIPFLRYIDKDNTYTDFVAIGKVVYIAGGKTEVTSKQITFELTSLDQKYPYFQLGFYHIQAGVTSALLIDKRSVSPIARVTISNVSQFTTIAPADLLVSSPYYTQASAITSHQNRLVLANVTEPEEINLQKVANKIQIRFKSTLVSDLLKVSTNCKNTKINPLLQANYGDGNIKTFPHSEVYAFYLVGVLPSGRRTRGFTIPGRIAYSDDVNISKFDNCRKKFEIENTALLDSAIDRTFIPGYWENADEVYPNLPEYESNAGQKVRHHVVPSIAFCKSKLYSNNKDYGNKVLDVIGVIAQNVIIPQELRNIIIGYEIYYAKRGLDNQRFLGQSLVLLGTRKEKVEITANGTRVNDQSQSTGGNWDSLWEANGLSIASSNILVRQDVVRLHAFDLLQYKPTIQDAVIIQQLKLRLNDLSDITEYTQLNNEITARVVDYTLNKTIVSDVVDADYYRSLVDSSYLPAQAYTDLYDNRTLETTYIATLDKPFTLAKGAIVRFSYGPEKIPFEETFLTNIMSLKTNVYQNFYNQELVYTGMLWNNIKTDVMYCGDGFVSDYSFVTYGLRESNDFNAVEGQRYIHRFIGESNSNIALRYEDDGNIYSNFYPKSGTAFLLNLDRNVNPNEWLYDSEYNKVYDISKVLTYNPYDQPITTHYNRLVFSAEEQKEKGLRSWRTFTTLDYVELEKEKGKIVALESLDQRLLVLMEHDILVSDAIRTLGGEDNDVRIKTLDLVEQLFVSIFDDNIGVMGSKQKFAFYKTPLGQIIIDQKQKNVYIYKSGLKKLNISLNTFFKDVLVEQGVNPYTENGYLVNYDSLHDRLLFTQKSTVSFTVSYSLKDDNWVSFHDYIPDAYIRQEGSLFCVKNNKIYRMNVGNYGEYFDAKIRPFYLDIPFRYIQEDKIKEFVTDNVSWTTQASTQNKTFTHITVYNPNQCSNRIGLYNNNWTDFNLRETEGEFYFDDIRDLLTVRGSTFLARLDQFRELLQTINLFGGKEWFNTDLISDKVVIVRVEDDNLSNQPLSVQNVTISITPSDR